MQDQNNEPDDLVADAVEPTEPAAPAPAPDVVGTTEPAAEPVDSADQQHQASSSPEKTPERPYSVDGWREELAQELYGEDDETRKKFLNQLERYGSYKDLAKNAFDMRQKIQSGEHKKSQELSENPTPEELQQYREANGIPESPDKYEISIGEGFQIGEDDQPWVDEFAKMMHQSNMSNDQLNQVLSSYYKMQDVQIQQIEQRDLQESEEVTDYYREEWGSEFKANMNRIGNLVGDVDLLDELQSARMPDGSLLGNSKKFIGMMDQIARQVMPYSRGSLLSGGTDLNSLESRKQEIENTMRTDRKAYNKNEKMQQEYREIIMAEKRLQG